MFNLETFLLLPNKCALSFQRTAKVANYQDDTRLTFTEQKTIDESECDQSLFRKLL